MCVVVCLYVNVAKEFMSWTHFYSLFKENCAFQQRAFIILPIQQHTYSEWLDEWAEPVSAYACTLSFYISLYLYSLVRYSVFTFVTLWPRAYLSLHTNAYATHSIFFRTWPFIHGRHTLKIHPHLSHHHIHNIPIWYGNWTNRSICKCSRYMWAFKTAVKIEKSKGKERHENDFEWITLECVSGTWPENGIALHSALMETNKCARVHTIHKHPKKVMFEHNARTHLWILNTWYTNECAFVNIFAWKAHTF